jgi:predicted DNA-binding transcriptional regulator AlpA
MQPNHRKVIALLNRGHNAAEVAEEVGLSRKRVFDLARRHQAPTNPLVMPGGRIERQIVEASRILTLPEIAATFRIAEPRIKEILSRVDRETKAALR